MLVLLILSFLFGHAGEKEIILPASNVTNLVNTVRQTPLKESLALNNIAQAKAEDMCKKDYWGHGDWLKFYKGYEYKYAGENLAEGFSEPEAVKAWVKSPEHYKNMVDKNFQFIGVGEVICHHYQNQDDVRIIVNEFSGGDSVIAPYE